MSTVPQTEKKWALQVRVPKWVYHRLKLAAARQLRPVADILSDLVREHLEPAPSENRPQA